MTASPAPRPSAPLATVLRVVLLAALFALPSATTAQQPTLPDEVRTWLERDQLQRWRALVAEGDSLFRAGTCVRCHGEDASGSPRGPDLTDDVWSQSDGSLEGIRRTIFWGVRPDELSEGYRFPMNPAGSLHLQSAEYDALAAWIWSRANDPRRPPA